MRFLLVAYDFPPTPSPQSIRWAYLVRELALDGHDVHVLAPELAAYGAGGLPAMPVGVTVHRAWPGPLAGYIAWRQRNQLASRHRFETAMCEASRPDAAQWDISGDEARLNWKGRLRYRLENALAERLGMGLNWKGQLMEGLKSSLSLVMFPDSRAEWMPWARRLLDRLLDDIQPDVVITSHEPANSIELGLHAKQRGFRWIADLGDPVLAPYTPPRWRKRAHTLESALCEQADVVTVTSVRARSVLEERHGIAVQRCVVLTQGFDHRFQGGSNFDGQVMFDPARLEMLYTGSFYAFRRVGELLRAVVQIPGARLNIATVVAPPEVMLAARRHPDKVRIIGFLAHNETLALQRRCDLLINLANDDPVQVPGKLYEYLGSGTPILNIGGAAADASTQMISDSGAGWSEPNALDPIIFRLKGLMENKQRTGRVDLPPSGSYDIMQHSWWRLSQQLAALLPPPHQSA